MPVAIFLVGTPRPALQDAELDAQQLFIRKPVTGFACFLETGGKMDRLDSAADVLVRPTFAHLRGQPVLEDFARFVQSNPNPPPEHSLRDFLGEAVHGHDASRVEPIFIVV